MGKKFDSAKTVYTPQYRVRIKPFSISITCYAPRILDEGRINLSEMGCTHEQASQQNARDSAAEARQEPCG